jgi:hypothetical protein
MGTRHVSVIIALLGSAGLIAGCASTAGSVGVEGPVTGSPSVVATTPGTALPTHTTATPTTPPASPTTAHTPLRIKECTKAAGLTVEPGSTDSSSGHRRLVLIFTNTSGRTCDLIGYPGVDALDGTGTSTAHAKRTPSGYEGGIPSGTSPQQVTLSPRESASAIVEALAYDSHGGSCTAYAGLLVTAPDDTGSTHVAWAGTDACSALEVHPMVSGSDG